jgi:hypothetical protein
MILDSEAAGSAEGHPRAAPSRVVWSGQEDEPMKQGLWFSRGSQAIPSPWVGAGMVGIALAACGGKVVVDATSGTGGAGGNASSTTTAATTTAATTTSTTTGTVSGPGGAGGAPASCMNAPPPGTLQSCGSTTTSAGSGIATCETDYSTTCGAESVWRAVCQTASCACYLGTQMLCVCTPDQPGGNYCGGTPSCCPWVSP